MSPELQCTGQMWLNELGMYFYKTRAFSATLGRFMQTDPIRYAAGPNLYAYVGNDPINLVDPLGLGGCALVAGHDLEWSCSSPEFTATLVSSSVGIGPTADDGGGGGGGGGAGETQCPTSGFVPPAASKTVRGKVINVVKVIGSRLLGGLGLILLPSGDTRNRTPSRLRHYTSARGPILATGYILPINGFVWLTPDYYSSGTTAQQKLALSNTPTGFFTVRSYDVMPFTLPQPVEPGNDQPGGGLEVKTPNPVRVTEKDWTPICP